METNATENTFETNIIHKNSKRPKKTFKTSIINKNSKRPKKTFKTNIIGENSKRLYNGTVKPPWMKNGTKEKPR